VGATVVNIALPYIQAGLGFSSTSLSWVLNGYTLTFGGSLGLAVLVAVFGTASRGALAHPKAGLTALAQHHAALAHGMSAAFGLAALFDVATLLLAITLFRDQRPAVIPAPARPLERVSVPDITEAEELD
jgi:hypothetical protein